MFDFGIGGYRPHWLNGRFAVEAAHGRRLRALIGRPLARVWLVRDVQDDEWFSDCPVLFDFTGEQVEINHQKFDDLSITWNTVDPRQPVRWADFDLQWRHDRRPELHALQDQVLQDVQLLEWTGDDMAQGAVAVSFSFPRGRLTIANALDDNELTFGPPDSRYQKRSLSILEAQPSSADRPRECGPRAAVPAPPRTDRG
ncbi:MULTISPECIES: hypothetical protein [Streptomyces]|uniref:Uncharacterized protein n=2 Tax=Streptomyces TaxID=1883 RepID=A0AA89QCS1_STRCU|nr:MULTISPECIES: hypothetical protein [Streptomyces]MBB5810719.1 hypothetical protein [Streptomyces collinus]MEC7053607.1 hypothetical protein [Streptomyces violaceochromogenes]WMX63993.1 hypothetical protein RFN52_11710 [Streptomyces collinus]GHC59903.1 hypothetical protein GCM10010309_20380 [Streptomyces violaceochromogenes]